MSEVDKPHDIPSHWEWRRLDQVGEIHSGSTPSTKEDDNFGGDIPWLTPGDLSEYDGKYVSKGERNLTEKGLESCSARLLPEGAILFSSRAPIGYTVIAQNPISTNQGFKNLVPGESIDNEFAYHYLKGSTGLAKSYSSGTTFSELSATRFAQIPIPVPPLAEQRRIVAKIEELFSNLDAGMDDLQAAGQQLERYRLGVLQAAVEGRLTADWRRTHDPEPADQLLERILEERRKQWEEDYREKYRKKERDLPSGWKSRYSEAEEPETEELEELPEGWTWTSLDQLLSNMRNGYSKAPKADDGVPILRISSVRPLSVNLDDVRYLEGKPDDYEKYLIEPGFLLFIRYNGNPGLVGACGAVPALDQPYAHPDKLIRGEVADHETVMPSYLEIALNMGPSREHIQNRVRTTAGQAGISQGDLYSCPVPVPPPAEQKQIVDEVERLLSVADDAAATAEREHTRAERLRQSILKQAFSGRLVPHEKNTAPLDVDSSSFDGQASSGSGDTGASSDEDEVIAEELYNGGDRGTQIEMDL